MLHEFIHPNWHIILIHYPLGLLVVGVLIELFAFLWRRSSFRTAGRWMIAIGAVSLVPAALTGLYALIDVVRMGTDGAGMTWNETMATSPLVQNADAWHKMIWHLRLQIAATLTIVLAVVLWIACSDRMRSRLHFLFLLLLLAGVGLMAAGAWYSGEAVYIHGTGVESDFRGGTPPVHEDTATQPAVATSPGDDPADAEDFQTQSHTGIWYYIDPIQTHLTMAGFAVGIALVSIGLSIRAMTARPRLEIATDEPSMPAAPVPPRPTTSEPTEREFLLAPEPQRPPSRPATPRIEQVLAAEVESDAHRVPSGRFWMLAFLLAAITAAGGWLVLAVDSETFVVQSLWDSVRDPVQNDGSAVTRRLAHVGAGVALVVLPLFLAMLARFAPRQKILLALLTLLLLTAVAAQVWFGVLLLYDTPAGPITKFNP